MSKTVIREYDGKGNLVREVVIERDEPFVLPAPDPAPIGPFPVPNIYPYTQYPAAVQNPCAACVGKVCMNAACPSAVRVTCLA